MVLVAIFLSVAVSLICFGETIGRLVAVAHAEVTITIAAVYRQSILLCPKTAASHCDVCVDPLVRSLRHDVDYAANGVRSPQRRLWALENFDALDVGHVKDAHIEPTTRCTRVVANDTVDQHQRLIAAGTSNTRAGLSTESSVLVDGDTRCRGQNISHMKIAARLNGLFVHDPGTHTRF